MTDLFYDCPTAKDLLKAYKAELDAGSKAYQASISSGGRTHSERVDDLIKHQSLAIQLNNAAITRLCELAANKEPQL